MTMAACACVIVEKLAGDPEAAPEDRKNVLEGLNKLLDTMDLLLPVVQSVTKFGLKHALLNLQLDRADAAIDDLQFLEEFKAELAEA